MSQLRGRGNSYRAAIRSYLDTPFSHLMRMFLRVRPIKSRALGSGIGVNGFAPVKLGGVYISQGVTYNRPMFAA